MGQIGEKKSGHGELQQVWSTSTHRGHERFSDSKGEQGARLTMWNKADTMMGEFLGEKGRLCRCAILGDMIGTSVPADHNPNPNPSIMRYMGVFRCICDSYEPYIWS